MSINPINIKYGTNSTVQNKQTQNQQHKKSESALVKSNFFVKASDWKDHPLSIVGLTIPVWMGITSFMKNFNKKCATTVVDGKETSILHSVQDASDFVGREFNSSKVGKTLYNGATSTSQFFKKNVVEKDKVLRAVFNTPSQPKLGMAKMISKGTIAETAQDASEAIQRYCAHNRKNAEQLGLMKMDKYKAVCAEPYKHLDDIKAMLKKMPDAPIEVCRFKNKFTNKMMSRKVYPSELINRINTLTGTSLRDESVKLTKAGKVVPKAFLRTMEGLTNGTAGGKLAILLQAYSVSDAILRAVNAPKGEKFATFAEALTFDLSYYLLMPLGMNLMYHGAGVKYTGMDKAAVERYRKGVKLLNEKVASGKCSKEQYIRVKKLLKKQLNGNSNIIDKPIKGVGRFLSTGLESIAPYTNDATSAGMKKFKNGMAKFKGISGGVMRCGLYMLAIAPLLANTATKVSHILFGKPTESVVDDVADTVPEQAVQIVTSFTDENAEAAMKILNNVSGTIKGFAGSDMRFNWDKQLKKVANNVSHEQVMNTIKPQKPNTAFDEDKKPSQKPKRLSTPTVQTLSDEKITYIPSTRAVKAPPEDLTKAKLALKSSLEAEKLTNKRFDNRFKREI